MLAFLLLAGPLAAQDARGSALTTVRYVTLRPLALDSVARADVTQEGRIFTYQGRRVTCIPGLAWCTFYRPADVEHGVVATQDVSATAWGFGVRGLSATVLVRGRADLNGDFLWPASDDHFDAILAYAQLQRSIYRLRLGRQRTLSGLGFSGFDGLDILVDPLPWLRAEAYAGRSLARGLNEPRHEALQGIEPFLFDRDALLFGGFVEAEPRAGTSLGLRYQREIWTDRAALLTERASLDVRSDLPGPLRMDAALDYDFAFGHVGKAHLRLRSALPDGWGWAQLTGRRYLPYFELWTIWGFFSPVAYHEAEASATITRWRPLTLWASAAHRVYDDTDAPIVFGGITTTAERLALGARWTRGPWLAHGEYRLELGFGAVLSSADTELRWRAGDAVTLVARASAFQQIAEFRLGDNVVLGGGLGADLTLPRGLGLRAGADLYRQAYENRQSAADWDQLRAHTILTVPFGAEPGRPGR
ncbi:MAG TPA: hypothetical protein VMM12_08550 [Longimicrobiales bacterium]|nr:hypothetical protein [Longimicrobiales bacterium]